MVLGGIALATDFAVLLVAATVLSYAARLTKQPTIVAYVLTGVVVGPIGLGIVAEDRLIEVVSELGLGFLLFLLGIEMRFESIRDVLRPVGAIAVGQALLQAVLSTVVALVLGFSLFQALVIALATTFGATPIIVKVLGDKDDLRTLYGRVDVGVLIVQDVYLVMALAILSVGTLEPAGLAVNLGRVLLLMALIGVAAFLASRYLLPTLLRASAAEESTLFTVGIAWAFLFVFAAETLDLSIEIGAFLAGLALAQLPYSTELKERLRPATNFFIAIFFASIALQMDVSQLLVYWQEAVLASVLLLAGNACLVFALFLRQDFDVETSFLGTISMLQVSEFSLVLGALAVDQGFVGEGILGFLSLMALLTMPLSTYYVLYNRRIYAAVEPYLQRFEPENPVEADAVEYEDHAVVVGYNRFTREAIAAVEPHVTDVVVIEQAAGHVEELQATDHAFVFGDARHGEIRQEANVDDAAVLVSAAWRVDVTLRLLEDAGTAPPDDAGTPTSGNDEDESNAVSIVTAETESDAQSLAGADYVVSDRGLLGERVGELFEVVEDPEAFERRLDDLTERSLSDVRPRTDGGGRMAAGSDPTGGDDDV